VAVYFAWVAAGTSFSAAHAVEDEEVFAFEIAHDEGDLPSATIDIKNPRIGLLNPGREVWAHLSEDDDSTDGVRHLFFGRLVGIPEQLQDEVVRLAFVARPADFDDQKRTLADTMRVLPYYDPLWVTEDRRDDPDAVLEGYTNLWHVDRLTHTVTASDIIAGEDGTTDLAGDFIRDSLDVTYGPAPVRRVKVEGKVSWTQVALGTVDITAELIAAFKTAGTTAKFLITSFTGEGLMLDWPEEGDRIGGGWEMGPTSVVRSDGVVVDQEYETTVLVGGGIASFPLFRMKPEMEVRYDVRRSYTETVTFELEADVQAIVTEPGDEEVFLITIASADADQPIDEATTDNPDGLPIQDLRARTYFNQARGRSSLETLIAIARAQLLARARTVLIRFDTKWENAVGLSCRKNVAIDDARLPGGTAAGKVIGYRLRMNGDTGERIGEVTIACTIGQGNTVSVVAGSPTYVEAGYVETGYQVYSGQTIMPIAGEVTYGDFSGSAPQDDGLNFFDLRPADIIDTLTVINGETTQRAVLKLYQSTPSFGGHVDVRAAANAVNEVFTEVDLTLVPVNTGPFETTYPITVSGLMVPQNIDLEAAAS